MTKNNLYDSVYEDEKKKKESFQVSKEFDTNNKALWYISIGVIFVILYMLKKSEKYSNMFLVRNIPEEFLNMLRYSAVTLIVIIIVEFLPFVKYN